MSPNKSWLGLVSSSLLVGAAMLYDERSPLPPYWFVPLVGASFVAAFVVGARRVPSPSLRRRLLAGGLWAVAWVAILPLPWAIRAGLFLWSAHTLPAPPGATYAIAPRDGIEYSPFRGDGITQVGGYQVVWRSGLSADEVERFYRERLPRRGWRLEWNREVVVPANGDVVRMLCFRRVDGFLVLRIAAASGKNAGFGLVYDHLASPRGYP